LILKGSGGPSKLVTMWKLVPNILTFARLALTIVFLGMILYWPYVGARPSFLDAAFVLFVIAGLTDVVDGHIARRWNATSKFGRIIDPLVDKVLVCGAFILVVREAYVTILRHRAEARGINFAAVRLGKIKMFVQVFAIGTVLIKAAHVPAAWGHWFTLAVFVLMVVITVVSGLQATRRVRTPAVC
jgi:CDP-diacylglycerol--glycerol-3-phosphate 3-phosphatidyltransferase